MRGNDEKHVPIYNPNPMKEREQLENVGIKWIILKWFSKNWA